MPPPPTKPAAKPLKAGPSPFYHRMRRAVGLSAALIGISLSVGVLGYHLIAGLDWVDALLNASMILSGMGPVDPLTTVAAKVFASIYALTSGLVFIGATGILLTPLFHHVLHVFHLEKADS